MKLPSTIPLINIILKGKFAVMSVFMISWKTRSSASCNVACNIRISYSCKLYIYTLLLKKKNEAK